MDVQPLLSVLGVLGRREVIYDNHVNNEETEGFEYLGAQCCYKS